MAFNSAAVGKSTTFGGGGAPLRLAGTRAFGAQAQPREELRILLGRILSQTARKMQKVEALNSGLYLNTVE